MSCPDYHLRTWLNASKTHYMLIGVHTNVSILYRFDINQTSQILFPSLPLFGLFRVPRFLRAKDQGETVSPDHRSLLSHRDSQREGWVGI